MICGEAHEIAGESMQLSEFRKALPLIRIACFFMIILLELTWR